MGYQNPLYAPSGVRIIYIFAGAERQGDIGRYLQQLGVVDSLLQFDLQRSHTHDLTEDGLWQHIFRLLGQEEWILLASPPCETFSRVRHRHPGPKPLRSSSYPRGFPWLSQQHALQVEQANYFLDQTVTACQLAWQYFLEHPEDLGVTPDKEIPASIWHGLAFVNFRCQRVPSLLQFSNAALRPSPQSPTRFLTNLHALVRQPPHLQRGPSLTRSIVTWDRSHPAAPMASINLCQVALAVCGPRLPQQHTLHCCASGSLMLCSPPLCRGGMSQLRTASSPPASQGSGTGQVSQATGAAAGQVSQSFKDHPSQASSGKPGACTGQVSQSQGAGTGTGQVSQSQGAGTGQDSQSFKDHPSQASSASSAHPVSGAGKASQSGKDHPSQASSVQAPSNSSSGLEPLADPQSVQVPSAALEPASGSASGSSVLGSSPLKPLHRPAEDTLGKPVVEQTPKPIRPYKLEPASGSASGSSGLGSSPLKHLHRLAEDTLGKPVVEQTPKPIRPYKGISPEDFAERISATRVPTRGELCALFGLLPHETPPRAPEAGNRVASSFTTGIYHQGKVDRTSSELP